jgi:hypothetical protein
MKIQITRSGGVVTFETVNVDNTETVFYTNLDTQEAHAPTLATNQVGAAPSANSSQCPLPAPPNVNPPYVVVYGCKLPGHETEQGVINVYAPLAAANTALQASQNQPINEQVANGGMPPYAITDLFVNSNTPVPGSSTKPGETLPLAPGVQLTQAASGISVVGTPTQAGTYNFTFTVNDSMGRNLQQVQYSLTVS